MKFVSKKWYGENVKRKIREISREEEERCAIRLANRVRAYVPVDTGKLKATVQKYESKLGKEGGFTVFAGEMPPGTSGRAYLMPRRMRYWKRFAFYALWVERGTKERFQAGGRYVGRMKARRFMRKAINIEKQYFFNRLRQRIK